MKLSDIMSSANLAIYAEMGLLIFLGVFLAVCVRALWPGQDAFFEKLATIPLADEAKPQGTSKG